MFSDSFASNLANEALCTHLATGAHPHARCHARAHPIHRHLTWHHSRHHTRHHPCIHCTLLVVWASVQTNYLPSVEQTSARSGASKSLTGEKILTGHHARHHSRHHARHPSGHLARHHARHHLARHHARVHPSVHAVHHAATVLHSMHACTISDVGRYVEFNFRSTAAT